MRKWHGPTSTSLLTFFLLWFGCLASAVGGGSDLINAVAVSTILWICESTKSGVNWSDGEVEQGG